MSDNKRKKRYEIHYTFDLIPNRECTSIVYDTSESKAKKRLIEDMQSEGTPINIFHITWMYCE